MSELVTTSNRNGEKQNPEPVKTWLLVLAAFLVVASGTIYLAISFLIKSFGNLYQGFGADLPYLTALVFDYGHYFGVVAVVALISLVLFFRERKSNSIDANRYFMWIIVCFGLSFVLFVLSIVAMYLPVFKLGATV